MITKNNVYVAACDENGGIYHYIIDKNGEISLKDFTPVNKPMYLAIENDTLYCLLKDCFSYNTGGLVSFKINNDGSLTQNTEPVTTKGKVPCHISVLNGVCYIANYVSGDVVSVPGRQVVHKGCSVSSPRQDSPHCHFAGITPDKKYVIVCDLGLDKIFTYDLELNTVSVSAVPAGKGCRHIAFSEDGKTAFCINELTGDISVFDYCNGVLTYMDTYASLPPDFTLTNTAAAIRVNNDKLYVSHRGHDSVAIFNINGKKLEFSEYLNVCGKHPRDIAINGNLLFAANELTDNVTVFNLEDNSFITELKNMKDPLCIVFN